MEACPAESTKRSRLCQTGSCGSKRRNCCHSVYATGAIAMGVPGCPEFAACTPSMDKVRMVLMLVRSMFCFTGEMGGAVAALIQNPFVPAFTGHSRMRRLWVAGLARAGHPLHPVVILTG